MGQCCLISTPQQTCPQNMLHLERRIHHFAGQLIHRLELFSGSIELGLAGSAVGSADDAVSEHEAAKVHEQPELEPRQPQVGDELRFMQWMQFLDCFEFQQ